MAFVHFRFTLQGEAVGVEGGQPAIYIMDLQVEPEVQRKGVGRHLMRMLEIIAQKQGMMHVMAPVVVKDENAKNFFLNGNTGFQLDDLSSVQSYDGQNAADLIAEDGTFTIYSKTLTAASIAADASAGASTPAKKSGAASSDGDLSAASTPEQDKSSRFGGAASNVSPISFDPSFGAPAAPSDADAAADTLLAELVERGVIPSTMGSEAKVLLQGLMLQYEEVNGRVPNGDDIAKWLGKIAEHAAEDAAAQGDEEDDEDSDSDQESDDEEDEDDVAGVK